MAELNDKTGWEIAQHVTLKRVVDRVVRQILDEQPDLSDDDLLPLVRERIMADPSLLEEAVRGAIGLRVAEYLREKGAVPDDPDRGDVWHMPDGTDR